MSLTTRHPGSRSPLLLVGLLALGFVSTFGSSAATAETIRIGGTGSALGVMRLLADAFSEASPGADLQVLPSLGSGGGIKALHAGAIHISVSSRPRKSKELGNAPDGIVELAYARSPLALVTSSTARDELLSVERLVRIYAGEEVAWPDGDPIRLVLRPESESDVKLLRKLSPDLDQAIGQAFGRRGMTIAVNDQDNGDALEANPGTLGAMTLGQLLSEGRALRPLPLDGVAPTVETLREGTYGLVKRYYVIANPESHPTIAAFLRFVQGPEGRRILEENGHEPIGPATSPAS